MAQIFVVTVFVSIIALTELSKATAASETMCNRGCHEAILPETYRVTRYDSANPNLKCTGEIQVRGCKGCCHSYETPDLDGSEKHHPVCYSEDKELLNSTIVGRCDPGVAKETMSFQYFAPKGCKCALCRNSDNSCEFRTKDIRSKSLSFNPREPAFVQSAEWEIERDFPPRSESQPSYPRMPAFMQPTEWAIQREISSPSRSQLSYFRIPTFMQLPEWKIQREIPPRSKSKSSYPRKPRWKNQRGWVFNFPPSPQYQVYYA